MGDDESVVGGWSLSLSLSWSLNVNREGKRRAIKSRGNE